MLLKVGRCLLVFLLSAYFAVRAYQSLATYSKYQLTTVSSHEQHNELTYPSVTLCPIYDHRVEPDSTNLTEIYHSKLLLDRDELLLLVNQEFGEGYAGCICRHSGKGSLEKVIYNQIRSSLKLLFPCATSIIKLGNTKGTLLLSSLDKTGP